MLLVAGAMSCSDDDKDSFEESYARAVCERDFDCYPDVARNNKESVGACITTRLAELGRRRREAGAACADATLDAWACQSQASCYSESNGQACATPLVAFQSNCPGVGAP